MLVSATSEVVRIMGVWVRRADAGLALTAARNAAASVADGRDRQLEEIRTLRDLQEVLGPEPPPAGAHAPASAHAPAVARKA